MKRSEGGAKEGRYDRQLIAENWKQERLASAKVLVAGIGALGSVVATNLAALGVGEIVLVDFDTIEISNLNRQFLFREQDVGKPKVDVASRRLSEFNSAVKIPIYNSDIRVVPREVYASCNVIVDSLDTFEDRRWLNSICVDTKKPLVHGGMYGWFGNVQIVIPFETPCLECQPLIPAERLQKSCTPPGERRKQENNTEEEKKKIKIPSFSTVSTIIGGIQAQETLKLILSGEETQLLNNYVFYDGKTESFTHLQLQRNPECIVCGDKFLLRTVEYAIDRDESIRSLKDRFIMSWGLVEPIRVILRGQMLQDKTRMGELRVGKEEALYIYDRSMYKPIRLLLKVHWDDASNEP
nr:ThiF family adenylyltransferase [Candidatus Njordarchaeota archaeon]